MSARVTSARAGVPELVRMPIHMRMSGYGCSCPWHFAGWNELPPYPGYTNADNIDPVFDPLAGTIEPGHTVVAEGYFTGKTTVFTGDMGAKEDLDVFHVLRARPPQAFPKTDAGDDPWIDSADARMVVLARGADAMQELPAPSDGRVFLVIAESVPLGSPGAYDKARAKVDTLRDRFPDAELVDSRNVPGLFCCNYVALLGRSATEKQATALAADGKKQGVATYVRRGWSSENPEGGAR